MVTFNSIDMGLLKYNAKYLLDTMPTKVDSEESYRQTFVCLGLNDWVNSDQPFYNVWPAVFGMSKSLKVDELLEFIELPESTIVRSKDAYTTRAVALRFHKGYRGHIQEMKNT